MKKLMLSLVSAMLILGACKKNENRTQTDPPSKHTERDEAMDISGKTLIDATYNGYPVKVVKLAEDTYLLDGDMLMTGKEVGLSKKPQTETSNTLNDLWPDKKVYYRFNTNATQDLKDYWNQAIQFYIPLGFKFIEGDAGDGAYINVTAADGVANSHVGRNGTAQTLNFDTETFDVGSLAHEIGHNLGLHHEQCRPDRDLYITVSSTDSNWAIKNSWGVGSFDFGSLMIYSSGSNAEKKNGFGWSKQRTALSATDKLGLNYMYAINGYLNGGTYEIKNLLSGKNLDVASDGNLVINTDNNANNQRWQLTHINRGYYKIISVANPSKGLEVTGNARSAGSDVGISNYTGADNQLWQIVPGAATGTYELLPKNALTQPLDIQNGSKTNGSNVLLGNFTLNNRTLWTMDAQ